MPFTSILDSAQFDITEFNLTNRSNFLLTRKLNREKVVVTCDIEYLNRFTGARHFNTFKDGISKFSSSNFHQIYINIRISIAIVLLLSIVFSQIKLKKIM